MLRSAICLARAWATPEPTKLREVSEEAGVPRSFVSQIMGDLVHSGIAVSTFGRDGGYRYRPPLGGAGRVLDDAVLARVARASVRSFLERVARALEEAPTRQSRSLLSI